VLLARVLSHHKKDISSGFGCSSLQKKERRMIYVKFSILLLNERKIEREQSDDGEIRVCLFHSYRMHPFWPKKE